MTWVRFTGDFDWWPSPRVTISYRAGLLLNVTRRCAKKAIEAGKAESATNPKQAAEVRPAGEAAEVENHADASEGEGQ